MNFRKQILSAALLTLAPPLAAKDAKSPTVLDLRESITDNAIVYPESFEQNTLKLLEGWYIKTYTTADDRTETLSDPDVSDDVMRKRLADLPTIIDMPYNQIVRSYIDRYTKRSRRQVAALLGLGTYYIPIFEQELEAQGLPLELKYLPVIESGLDPNAVSKHGAAGLWQMMIGTGKGLGLEVNTLVDERRDPYLSTQKAVGYLKDLYNTYDNWTLAIAAYNCGPNAVNKALRRAGGDPKSHDFWSIYSYLPEETRGYVPMFIAANYVMTYYPEHNISPVLSTKPVITDTIAVGCRLHLNQVSEVLDIPVSELRILNPQFRADIIPATPERTYHLTLPSQQVQAYIVSEKEIIAHDADKYARRETAEPDETLVADTTPSAEDEERSQEELNLIETSKTTAQNAEAQKNSLRTKTVTHKVVAGETLASIAQNYGVAQSDIKNWNNMTRNAVRAGQQLKIEVPDDAATDIAEAPAKPATSSTTTSSKTTGKTQTSQKTNKPQAQKKPQTPKTTSHTVANGESLEKIAKKNGTTVDELRKANPNLKGDLIHPGDKITIPAKGAASTKKATTTKKSSTGTKKSTGSKKKGSTSRKGKKK